VPADWVACLDADVLIGMPECDLLLEIVETGLYSIRWSPSILAEVKRNLRKASPTMAPEKVERRLRTMRETFEDAMVRNGRAMENAVPAGVDPEDRHVVATALVARANVVVTRNVGHFARSQLAPLGLLVQDPDTFLVHQVGQDARAVGVAVGRIIGRLHKTRPTVDEYLQALEAPLPRFATAMRDCRQLIVLPPVR
jgi:predicted nucleic acid-binding protein